jgi:hypothetical protein
VHKLLHHQKPHQQVMQAQLQEATLLQQKILASLVTQRKPYLRLPRRQET